jgi:hypothetical protein
VCSIHFFSSSSSSFFSYHMRHVAFIWRYKPYGTEKKSKKASHPRIFSSSRKLCLRIASKSDSQSPCQRHNYVCTMCRYPRRRCRSIPMKFRARLRLPRNMLRNRRQHQYSAIAFIHYTHTHKERERERVSILLEYVYMCVCLIMDSTDAVPSGPSPSPQLYTY